LTLPITADACEFENGDFSEGSLNWVNESEGPGLSAGLQEVIPVDGRPDVLHLDSRACSNYYLFWSQVIDVTACQLLTPA
jgi:hypothetical protein